LKALFTMLTVNRSKKRRLDRDSAILIFAVLLTVGLVAFYVIEKTGALW
jgi:hypothetical protein